MKYTKETIYRYAESTGFIGSNIEKVARLLDDSTASRITNHPMAKWRINNLHKR